MCDLSIQDLKDKKIKFKYSLNEILNEVFKETELTKEEIIGFKEGSLKRKYSNIRYIFVKLANYFNYNTTKSANFIGRKPSAYSIMTNSKDRTELDVIINKLKEKL